MPKTTKAAKKRTQTKTLSSKKKNMSAKEMKKVKGGVTAGATAQSNQSNQLTGLLLPAVQKVREA
jgi:hypothetical protein